MSMEFGGATRIAGGKVSRFRSVKPHARQAEAALKPDHPAITDGRTLFPTTVVNAEDAPRLLVSGTNSAKIGGRIRRGAWSGLPVYTLTLEERATCPRSCDHWATCYGNAMPMARRHRHGPELLERLERELSDLLAQNRQGIAVRLHVLGDFWSTDYVREWAAWMYAHPRLRVWGYTAHPPDSDIGRLIAGLNDIWPARWVVRFSVPAETRQDVRQATTIWRQPDGAQVPEGLVCPASSGATQACSTCGLCWDPEAAAHRIVFIGHGMRKQTGKRVAPDNPVAKRIDGAGGPRAVANRLEIGIQTVKRWRITGYVPPYQRAIFDRATAP